jgi:hypothetical protein
MFSKLMPRLSPATPLALIALFVALGGVSYAAATIGTSAIQNGAVTTPKLKKNAVTTAKIKADAVTGAKVQESTLTQVPSAEKAVHANSADSATKAGHANTAGTADSATSAGDALELGGVPAAQFGSGIVGAAVTAPPAAALAPSGATGAPIGSGDEFQMPVPVGMKIKNLFVRVAGDASRPFVLSLRNPGEQAITCGGAGACAAPGPVSFEPGDVLELAVNVLPGAGAFAGATYQVGYQIVP